MNIFIAQFELPIHIFKLNVFPFHMPKSLTMDIALLKIVSSVIFSVLAQTIESWHTHTHTQVVT